MPLTARQHEILIGTLLGDGCLEQNGRHVRLKVDHSAAQKAYALWKYAELRDVAAAEPYEIAVADARTGNTYRHVRFATRSDRLFDPYRAMFYQDGCKRVPAERFCEIIRPCVPDCMTYKLL
ncbi:MAG: hypothetical protein NZT92_11080 [Abditibacteriales bacterium]|nr:hypothetical protein [Abditibacteriales bacterium]